MNKEMPTHSSILTWRLPWTEESGKLAPWGPRELDTTEVIEHAHTDIRLANLQLMDDIKSCQVCVEDD